MERWKRALSILLAVTMVLSIGPISAFATPNEENADGDDFAAAGVSTPSAETPGENGIVYTHDGYQYAILADGTISILGYTGAPEDGADGICLEIPASLNGLPVSQIAEEAFAYNETICALLIPESVTAIGNAAFYHCAALKAIAFCGACPAPGITVAEGSHALEQIFTLKESDIAAFCALLVNDLGEDGARAVEIAEYDDLSSLLAAFHDYVDSFAAGTESENNSPALNETALFSSGNDGGAATAAEVEGVLAEGSCGEKLNWVLYEDGALYITGTGAMGTYSPSTAAPWYAYASSITSLVLSDGITTIGDYAFYKCAYMTGALTIPNSVTTIGAYAFQYCSKLTGDLTIPSSVTNIGSGAFYGCSGFSGTLTLSENLTSISSAVFRKCQNMTGEIVVPNGVTTIYFAAFSEMPRVTSLVLGEKITTIYTGSNDAASHAFYGMTGLKEITFQSTTPPAVTKQMTPFLGMTGLETIYVPAEAYSAYAEAYKSYIPDTARLVSRGAAEDFQIDGGVLTAYFGTGGEVIIPNTVTEIGTSAFQNCTTLTKITIPESVTTIGASAFQNCTNLAEIVFSEGLKGIGSNAFRGCTALAALNLPGTLESIGAGAFQNCTAMAGNLTIPAAVAAIGESAFSGCTGLNGKLVIVSVGNEAGEKTIGSSAFYQCSRLTGLELGSGITAIGNSAFADCSGMGGNLIIPDSVTAIGAYAFSGCIGFSGKLAIPDKVTSLDIGVFKGMSGITSVVVGESVASIYTYSSTDYWYPDSFYGMSGVDDITFLGLTVPTMKEGVLYTSSWGPFHYMTDLKTIHVPVDAYGAYVAAYAGYVSDSVVFSTDFIHAKITNFAAEKVYSETVVLSWDAHLSESVVGYTISRDGNVVGTTAECSFTDRAPVTGTSYTYSVQGYTESGRTTPASEITVTPVAPQILDIQTDNSRNRLFRDHNTIHISVTNAKNLQPLGGEETTGNLYFAKNGTETLIGSAALDTTLGNDTVGVFTIDWDISALEDGEYTLKFVLTDIDGASATYSETAIIDRSVPAQIIGVSAVGDVEKIYLSWAISGEADTAVYRVYRRAENDELFTLAVQINDRNTLTYTDTKAVTGTTYYYYVVGVDELGREGETSEIVSATLSPDTEPPTVTKLTPANAGYLSGTVHLSLLAEDNVSVAKAALYYSIDDRASWTLIAEMTGGSFKAALDTTAIRDGVIHIKGIAFDPSGNESSALTYVYSIDNTGPEQVKGLAYESTNVTITLRWDDVSDDDIRFYRVERQNADGSYSTVSDVYRTLGLNLYDLTPDTEYTCRVVGYDARGNRGTPSETITAKTMSDTTAPVVTKIRPTSGSYSSAIPLSITATDEHSVAQIVIQTAADGTNWNTVYSQTYSDTGRSRTLAYTLDLSDYGEGYLFVRAIATDAAGNESDSSASAPYVQHMVDKTAPAAPENVTAVGNSGYIEVSWVQGAETDLGKYAVYRSESENGTYTPVKSGIAALNYIDRNVAEGVVYYYKVSVTDTAGNYSEASSVVSAEVIRDTEVPMIVSIYPESGSRIGTGYKTVSVLATDNHALDTLVIEYSKDGQTYAELYRAANINAHSKTATASIPISEFADGAAVSIHAYATDKSGNQSATESATYAVDAVAPAAKQADAVYDDESVQVSWKSNQEEDLIGYRVYRKTGATGAYSLISQRQAVAGQSDYSCYDYNLSIAKTSYIYKIEAVDSCGNVSSIETAPVGIPDRSAPKPVISCDATMEVGVEYYIDASSSSDNSAIVSYFFDFGDSTTSTLIRPTHTYRESGEYTITLTVTDDDGNQAICTKQVTVKERAVLGTARIRIVDENGTAVAGAPVYFDLGEETQVVKSTNSSGYATFTAEVGRHTVGCIIADNNWLPAKKDIIIVSNEETSVSMTLVHHVMVEGQFEITRMTFDEIVAAGIDVSRPENQYMVNVNVTLSYGTEKVETSFTYNETTGQTIARPTIVSTTDGQKRLIVPVVLTTNRGSSGAGSSGDNYTFSYEASIAYLDIPVGVSALKEFFNVNLHIINNAAAEFSMVENVIQLNVPDGLTIVDSYISESSPSVSIAEIKGQTTETITWILRGDQIGEYYLSADYSGILSEFNEPVYTRFVATEPIEVYGLSNLKLKLEIPEELDHGTFYYNVSLRNNGTLDVYRPEINTGDTLIETQLFDATGADITDRITIDAEDLNDLGLATSISGTLDTLPAGYQFTKHYMNVEQTTYTERKQKLVDHYTYAFQNTYGLEEIEIVTQPVSYFKSNLSANINAAEKAELTFTTNRNAMDYLMSNENYIYWSMYASTGEVSTALTSKGQENLWNLLKVAAGSGDFKSLFGADDEALIQAIILDAMELSVEGDDYSRYYHVLNWTSIVKDWLKDKNAGGGELTNILLNWLKQSSDSGIEEVLAQKAQQYGDSLLRTFDVIEEEYKWEAYKTVYEGEYLDFDNFIYAKWKMVIEEEYSEYTLVLQETDASQLLHDLFSRKSVETVWKALGVGTKAATMIVNACKDTSADVSLYIVAQSDLDSCNYFLNTLISYADHDRSGDVRKVSHAAAGIWEKMSELDPVGSFAESMLDEAFWKALNYEKKAAIKKLGLTPSGYVKAVKYALKLTSYVGDNVFNVSDRHKIANNIRFVSCMTLALQYAIREAQIQYQAFPTDDYAKAYMQLVSYLLNIRAIGESQVAQFGISYEVIPELFDSEELFLAVREMSGAAEAASWIEWRDFVEDKISLLRVQLLKNPVSASASGATAPIVTFDYAAGQTAQTFSGEYEYSLDSGKTWTSCSGSAIAVAPQTYSVRLLVRRIDRSSSDEKMTGAVTIYAAPSLSGSGIRVQETEDGYRIENLDNSRLYEVTFSQEALSYNYGDALTTAIPRGSYSFHCETSEIYDYVYIRSVADAKQYASHVFTPQICRKWVIDETTAMVSGISEGTTAETVVAYFRKFREEENVSVSILTAAGEEATDVGTGYRLNIGEACYPIVVLGDVDGNAEIDLFDLKCMVEHMNGEQELSGAYLAAGCVRKEEDIDLFDLRSMANYISDGSFESEEDAA